MERAEAESVLDALRTYWERSVPTFIENWPKELCSLSVAQIDIPLTLKDAADLGMNQTDLFETWLPEPPGPSPEQRAHAVADFRPPGIGHITAALARAIEAMPNGAFVRLGSRSPKDSWAGHDRVGFPRVFSSGAALNDLCGASERINDDLHRAVVEKYAPHIWVREWKDIEPQEEFRCFMRDRKLVGISQYDYRTYYPWIDGCRDKIVWAIERFFEQFVRASHLDTVIFDVFVKLRPMAFSVTLLEINPYFQLTDPCLFDWRDPSMFDGHFEFVASPE